MKIGIQPITMKPQYYSYFWGRLDIDTLHTDSRFKDYKLLNM